MKFRNGFVSNSSSSSFMVGFPKGLSDKEKEALLFEKIGVTKDSFLFPAAKGIAECILGAEKIEDKEEWAKEECYNSFAEMEKEFGVRKGAFKNDNLDYYDGSAGSDAFENVGEILFCDMEWFVNDDDFFMSKDASF